MERECIRVPGRVQHPIASPAVRAGGLVFTTGTIGADPETGELVSDDISGQAHQALENIKAVLEAAGTSMDNVVKVTCFLLNVNDKPALNEVYQTYFKNGMPARVAVGVASLNPGVLIEMEAIATMPD